MVEKAVAAKTAQEFAKAAFPSDLFDGFSNEETIERTISSMLDSMMNDRRNHRELAMRYDFSICGMAPLPHVEAAKALCLKHGLHPETFLLLIHSNLTWLEHHASRLGSDPPPAGLDVQSDILEPDPQEDIPEVPQERPHKKKAKKAQANPQEEPAQDGSGGDAGRFEDACLPFIKALSLRTLAEYLAAAASHFGRRLTAGEQGILRTVALEHMAELELKVPVVDVPPQPKLEIKLKASCHTIGTDKPVMAAGSASARKSFMSDLTNVPCRCKVERLCCLRCCWFLGFCSDFHFHCS